MATQTKMSVDKNLSKISTVGPLDDYQDVHVHANCPKTGQPKTGTRQLVVATKQQGQKSGLLEC